MLHTLAVLIQRVLCLVAEVTEGTFCSLVQGLVPSEYVSLMKANKSFEINN